MMASKKIGSNRLSMQGHSELLASRVREIRLERFGVEGLAHVSQTMNIPARTWDHYENGVLIPGWILLQFIEITGVEPHWLSTGEGERYRVPPGESLRSASR